MDRHRSILHVLDLPEAVSARVDESALVVGLADGRELHVPVSWFPWLREAAPAARARVELVANGIGLHWPLLDADVFVLDLLAPEQLPPAR